MGAARTCLLIITIHFIHSIAAQEKRDPPELVGPRETRTIDLRNLETYKRKPQYHFLGVKGKRDMFDFDPEYKRTPAFVGMRGKKDFTDMYFPEDFANRGGSLVGEIDYSPNDSFDVKSENPVFNDLLTQYLMRLQQEASMETPESDEEMTNEVSKRAANMRQFYGVRGKRQQKRPVNINFRGKFIGVRGKKDVKNSGAQEIKFLVGDNEPWPKRRQGFFGMRGKKWTDEASGENESTN